MYMLSLLPDRLPKRIAPLVLSSHVLVPSRRVTVSGQCLRRKSTIHRSHVTTLTPHTDSPVQALLICPRRCYRLCAPLRWNLSVSSAASLDLIRVCPQFAKHERTGGRRSDKEALFAFCQ